MWQLALEVRRAREKWRPPCCLHLLLQTTLGLAVIVFHFLHCTHIIAISRDPVPPNISQHHCRRAKTASLMCTTNMPNLVRAYIYINSQKRHSTYKTKLEPRKALAKKTCTASIRIAALCSLAALSHSSNANTLLTRSLGWSTRRACAKGAVDRRKDPKR